MSDALHIVCPHCQSTNRVPVARLNQSPSCGRCKNNLFFQEPVELTAASFQRQIKRNDIPVLVDFWAPWCGPCKMMAPQFQQAAKLLEPKVRLAKVNTEAEPSLASQYAVRSIPTLVIFKRGREIARQPGAMNSQDIVRWATSHLGS